MKINWAAVISAAISTFFTHALSVPLGNGVLSASVNGAPVHLTANAVFAAAGMAFEGLPASIQSGSVLLTYTPNGAAPPTSA